MYSTYNEGIAAESKTKLYKYMTSIIKDVCIDKSK